MKTAQILVSRLRDYLKDKKKTEVAGSLTFRERVEGAQLVLKIADFGKYSVAIRELSLSLSQSSAAERSPEALQKWADRLASKATYLLENLRIIEEDTSSNQILLRSELRENGEPPVAYFELILTADGSVSLKRFEYDKEKKAKSQVPFNLTTEVLERLLGDMLRVY